MEYLLILAGRVLKSRYGDRFVDHRFEFAGMLDCAASVLTWNRRADSIHSFV